MMTTQSRRQALNTIGAMCGLPWLSNVTFAKTPRNGEPEIATNIYPWLTFSKREGETCDIFSDGYLAEVSKAKLNGFEPIVNSAKQLEGLGERLTKHKLLMRSIYVNSTLHDPTQAKASTTQVVEIAKAVKQLGTTIVVTNPSPIKWGGSEDKTDEQLRFQAKTLNDLGHALRELGMVLAYHNHDAELRQGAREFHHMLTATDPENVKLCLDAHWVFRGCGDSEVAVFDALTHYYPRIVELHLRQSLYGVWTETFQPQGDIDYVALIQFLAGKNIHPHLVLEQAVEAGSPNTMTATKAHLAGRNNLAEIYPLM